MSQNQDLQSYKTFKSYLDSIDVDTSNMDNDTLDYQYLQRLRKKNGEALSTQEQREGGIAFKQYLADAQALQNKTEAIAQAENNARQETAYNDYVNSKLAKYLNIAEENNGTAGYTGITEGNRIALANQEKNIASNIQNTKQNAISDYLKQYDNTLASNSRNALDEMTTMQSTFDQNEKTEKSAYKAAVTSSIENIIDKYNAASDGSYDSSVLDEITKYINESKLTDDEKKEILRQVNASYNFKKTQKPLNSPTTDQDGNIIDTIGLNHGETFKTSIGDNSIDEASNNLARDYNFNLGDGKDRTIKATFDNNNNQVAEQILSTFALGKAGKDLNALNDSVSKLNKNEWGAFTFKTDKGEEICKVIVYKKANGECVVFVYNKTRLYNSSHESDFNALWKKIENSKKQIPETPVIEETTPA